MCYEKDLNRIMQTHLGSFVIYEIVIVIEPTNRTIARKFLKIIYID